MQKHDPFRLMATLLMLVLFCFNHCITGATEKQFQPVDLALATTAPLETINLHTAYCCMAWILALNTFYWFIVLSSEPIQLASLPWPFLASLYSYFIYKEDDREYIAQTQSQIQKQGRALFVYLPDNNIFAIEMIMYCIQMTMIIGLVGPIFAVLYRLYEK